MQKSFGKKYTFTIIIEYVDASELKRFKQNWSWQEDWYKLFWELDAIACIITLSLIICLLK